MDIKELLTLYARQPQVRKLASLLADKEARHVQLSGLRASAPALALASAATAAEGKSGADGGRREARGSGMPSVLFCVLDDAEEAGYFYHDVLQLLGEERVLFFPSSFRRAVKFGQRDAASEILRTEVLARISADSHDPRSTLHDPLFIISYPEAVAERVVSKQELNDRTLSIRQGERVDIAFVEETLMAFGFQRTDYVYEPGQFAVRGSLVDVFSYACEFPYRIDFFGDEVDSIRTFEVETQLSRARQEQVTLVPELGGQREDTVPLATLLPADTVVVTKNLVYVAGRVGQIWDEGFTKQAEIEVKEGSGQSDDCSVLNKKLLLIDAPTFERGFHDFRQIEITHAAQPAPLPGRGSGVGLLFSTTAQPIFHKNFELAEKTFANYLQKGYTLYILADSQKQTDRLKAIFSGEADNSLISFTPVSHTLHAGFADDVLKVCLFTDNQIFDRFHKYNLRSERARSGKVALSLKELQEFEIGDYVVHIDHGIGRFGGLVRVPSPDGTMQEMIKITYDRSDAVYVSIHSLHKVSKYKGKEGEPPRISRLGTGAWERMKERTKTKIKDIARDLIQLYSRRREEKGFAFSPDTYMQHELEASFLYEDTPDQLKATNAIGAGRLQSCIQRHYY